MIIYSSAKLTEKLNVCEGGIERTKAALAKHGLPWDAKVTARWGLDNLGVHDTIFSMGRVYLESRENADKLLLMYLAEVELALLELVPSLQDDAKWPELRLAKQCVSERVRGLPRPRKRGRAAAELAEAKSKLVVAEQIEGFNIYLALLSNPLYLAATHAGKSLCELAAYEQKSRRAYMRLHNFLKGHLDDA